MRRRSLVLAWTGSIAFSLVAPGCQGAGGFAQIQERLASIDQKQDALMGRIAAVEDKLDRAPAPAPGNTAKKRPNKPKPELTYKVNVSDEPAKGPATAKVTLVEWSDFQCPFCSRVGSTLKQLQKDYGDDLRIVFKHNPLSRHPRAMPAAVAAEAARKQGKFWEMHDKLFANAKQLTDENFLAWAAEIGLDLEAFKKDLTDPGLKQRVTRQQRQGMTLGAGGTPSFFINGRFLSGARPVESFKALIDEEMNKADALLAKGIARDKLYDAVIAKGQTKV